MTLNRDFFTALVFLLFSVGMFAATFSLPEPMFGQLASWAWPRVILVPMGFLSVIMLVQSQKHGGPNASLKDMISWFRENRNPFICFALFFGFLLAMPVLGMLLGGLLFVFLTLNVLGGWTPRQVLLHAVITAVCVIGMWAIFSLMLGVVLPEGTILRVY